MIVVASKFADVSPYRHLTCIVEACVNKMSVRSTIKEKKYIPAPSSLMMRSHFITLSLLSLLNAGFGEAQAQEYKLLKDYSGKSFFDDWTFISKFDDLMNGTCSLFKPLALESIGRYLEPAKTSGQAMLSSLTERRPPRSSWPSSTALGGPSLKLTTPPR